MEASTRAAVGSALRALRLKDMDPSLLSFAVLRESAELGIDVSDLATALELAAYLHRDDLRGNRKQLPVEPYVTHPFRLVLRLVRYGCRDTAVLCAAALHDTVEDHPDELVALLAGTSLEPLAPTPIYERAVALLTASWGPDVARIVLAVTNPSLPTGASDERNQVYRAHVEDVITDPQVFLVKVSDFIDNAGSLHHLADSQRRARLARKYAPLVPGFRDALEHHRTTLGLGEAGQEQLGTHLAAIAERLGP